MKPKWKSVVEFVLGIVGTILVSVKFFEFANESNWLWLILSILALFFYTDLIGSAWKEL